MKVSVAVRGIGLLTPLGHGVDANWQALLGGRHLAGVGRIDLADPEAGPRVDLLAARAVSQALGDRSDGSAAALLASRRTALVVGTSRGAVDDWIERQALPAPAFGFGLSSLVSQLARRFGHGHGPRATFSGACASGLHALIHAVQLIEHGMADDAIVVGAESSLHPIFLQSFRRLGVLAPPGERCRPFDMDRKGLLVSEAAAAVRISRVLEPLPGDVLIDRHGYAGDAAHLTGFDPSGTTIRRLLATALDDRPVDVIHAHGTGTIENDAAEAAAIDAVLCEQPTGGRLCPPPAVYSHKGAIGHSLGASGLISLVLNVMMHRHGVVPPNVGVQTPIPMRHAGVARATDHRPVNRSIVCAAGFGGATAAVSLMTAQRP